VSPPEGLLVIDKPEGPTSHDIVDRVRRLAGIRRVGHTGTLDPMATGVLPVCLGRATRLARFIAGGRKTYAGIIRLGVATDTYDREGRTTRTGDFSNLAPDEISAAAARFRGEQMQTPPPYSARKVGGVPAHRLARRGAVDPLEPRPVTVYRLDLLEISGSALRFEMVTSPGTYVRSIAHDLGHALSCGGHLEELRRTAAGALTIASAVPIEALERATRDGTLADLIIPMRGIDLGLPTVTLTDDGVAAMKTGRPLSSRELAGPTAAPLGAAGPVRVLDGDGELIGIAVPAKDGPKGAILRPDVVLVA